MARLECQVSCGLQRFAACTFLALNTIGVSIQGNFKEELSMAQKKHTGWERKRKRKIQNRLAKRLAKASAKK